MLDNLFFLGHATKVSSHSRALVVLFIIHFFFKILPLLVKIVGICFCQFHNKFKSRIPCRRWQYV